MYKMQYAYTQTIMQCNNVNSDNYIFRDIPDHQNGKIFVERESKNITRTMPMKKRHKNKIECSAENPKSINAKAIKKFKESKRMKF